MPTHLDALRERYPEKLVPLEQAFARIGRGSRIFLGTGCGEPQHLVAELVRHVEANPGALVDTELYHVWTLGVAPYAQSAFAAQVRHESFFVSTHTREAVNAGHADYAPVFLSRLPDWIRRGLVPVDVALVQVSGPDAQGYLSLGISVDVTKAALEQARLVIAQVNRCMPRVHGAGFVHASAVDVLVPFDEPLLELAAEPPDAQAMALGAQVARLVRDGDTLQVGYGRTPNAILAALADKRHLGIHTELLSDGLVALIEAGAVDNRRKSRDRGKTVASFCMGSRATYDFLDDNPSVQFEEIDAVNDPRRIARIERMTAINSALQIDLTGQATAESIDAQFYSGIGGSADFMRGAPLAPGGKTILVLPSTADEGAVSRIVPQLAPGAGVTFGRGDLQYVVTEHGLAYLPGKNVRERAMALIAIAEPRFQPALLEAAKRLRLVYADQAHVPGQAGVYPAELESRRTLKSGREVLLRPVKLSDEPLLKAFFYALSDESVYRRFLSFKHRFPHRTLQQLTAVDHTQQTVLLAVTPDPETEQVLALGQYAVMERTHTADVAFVVRDDCQGEGLGRELLTTLTRLARRAGLLGFTADVLADNRRMLHLFETQGFDLQRRAESGVLELRMAFDAPRVV